MRNKKWKSLIAFLCILIIIAYASIVFLPHTHDGIGSDCTVCALIGNLRNTMIGLVLAATAHRLANIVSAILSTNKSIPSGNSGTLVALKVKLSN